MKELIKRTIEEERLIAIVRGVAPDKCLALAKALYDGGFRLMEITFDQRNPKSWSATTDSIRAVGEEYRGRMEVGAGTVISEKLVELAAEAGAKYIISPDTNLKVIARTLELGLVSMPGALTPSEILTAYDAGADYVKLFPISDLGPNYVKAICAPIGHVPMMAVGGINETNLKTYLDLGMKGAGIGGNLVNKKWIENGEYEKITETARTLVEIAKG